MERGRAALLRYRAVLTADAHADCAAPLFLAFAKGVLSRPADRTWATAVANVAQEGFRRAFLASVPPFAPLLGVVAGWLVWPRRAAGDRKCGRKTRSIDAAIDTVIRTGYAHHPDHSEPLRKTKACSSDHGHGHRVKTPCSFIAFLGTLVLRERGRRIQ